MNKARLNMVGLGERSSTENSVDFFYQNQMDEELLKAAKFGDLLKVQECVKNGVDINVTNPGGLNSLHFAARENHPEIAELVLKQGIDIEAITKRLNSALHIASLGGHFEVTKLLCEHGAKLNVQAKDEITPLYMAAQEDHVETVSYLLKKGANAHIPAKGGFEPVDIAVQQGHAKVVAMLLEHDVRNGLHALHIASRKDDVSMMRLLVADNQNINERAPNGYTPLHLAAKHGSVNVANFLIDNRADLNTPAKHNICPIHVAAKHGSTHVLSALIEGGAKLNLTTKDGLSALHCAARDGHIHCVELLLVHGAPVTAKTKHGLTALHMATQGNHTGSANHILAHGAHIDDVTTEGVTPLHICSHYGHVETSQLLIDRGADLDKQARNGYTALHIAAKKNREAVVQLLLKHKASVHVQNNNWQIPLHVAAYFGHANIVLLLLQAGADIEACTIRGESVLHIACRTLRIQIVRLLLRNGANANPKSKDENTPLHNACLHGNSTLVNLLLDSNANPDTTDKDGATALHLGARDGNATIVESLLDHNADVSIISKQGFTPLHEAAKNGNLKVIQLLLDRKPASHIALYRSGLTPLHLACHYEKPEAAMKFLNHGSDPNIGAKNGFTPLHISAKKNQVSIVSSLLDRGVEPDNTTKNGISPLHLAAQQGNVEVVDLLLDNGTSPGIQTTNGLTPLHLAVHYNRIKVVRRLLKYGAKNSPATLSGFTPLHLAAIYGHTEVARTLLDEGADVEAKTRSGNTPLHMAAFNGHHEIIDLLLNYNAPPNTLNKDGCSALYIAEVTHQKSVISILIKVTKISIIQKEGREVEDVENIKGAFTSPEDLEEGHFMEFTEEPEYHAHGGVFLGDFDETLAGLDETRSEYDASTLHTSREMILDDSSFISHDFTFQTPRGLVNELPVTLTTENGVESGIMDFELDGINAASSPRLPRDEVTGGKKPVLMHQSSSVEPPKRGTFLVSFYVDARGGVMESKQTGIRMVLPRGACSMPTRITCRVEGSPSRPQLSLNEDSVSRTFQCSPPGLQFLKPVVMEIPHYGVTKDNGRELVVMRTASHHSSWKEHVSSLIDDCDVQDTGSASPCIKIILQDLPEKVVVVSRPKKERFLMFPEGGSIESSFMPDVKVVFATNTLNTTTKVVLQVQECDNTLLPQGTYVSPIVSLDPLTILSKPISINVPCDWLLHEQKASIKDLRLLGWMPRSPRKSTIERVQCLWKDITSQTPLSAIGANVTFSTTEFTKYWLIQAPQFQNIYPRVGELQNKLSGSPFLATFSVHVRRTRQRSSVDLLLTVAERTHEQNEAARSEICTVCVGQVVQIKASTGFNHKLTFGPFHMNRLTFDVEYGVEKLEFEMYASSRDDSQRNVTLLCRLNVDITKQPILESSLPSNAISDGDIELMRTCFQLPWFKLADQLKLTESEKQAIVDLSGGVDCVSVARLLVYWRSNSPQQATRQTLREALIAIGETSIASDLFISLNDEPASEPSTPHELSLVDCSNNVTNDDMTSSSPVEQHASEKPGPLELTIPDEKSEEHSICSTFQRPPEADSINISYDVISTPDTASPVDSTFEDVTSIDDHKPINDVAIVDSFKLVNDVPTDNDGTPTRVFHTNDVCEIEDDVKSGDVNSCDVTPTHKNLFKLANGQLQHDEEKLPLINEPGRADERDNQSP